MSRLDLPGFEIIERIGKGGMAEVWKARQISLDRLVAIKILTNQSIPDEQARAHFKTEVHAAARLNHPGIVQVYDAGEQNGEPYYVMEFVEGRTLGDVLEERPFLPEDNVLVIAECVAMALAHAWEKGRIIHCDIKPDNVMVARDGSVKIADLGLARMIDTSEAESDLVLGTPNYASPEQANGAEKLDCRTDIYSLGAMLYHLVTGQLPFRGSPGSSAMDLQITGYLDDPMDVRPGIKPATAWLIEKMMIKDPLQRPQTWEAVLADIRLAQDGRLPAAPLPASGLSTIRRSPRRPGIAEPTPSARVVIGEPEKKKIFIAADQLPAPTRPGHSFSVTSALVSFIFLAVCTAGVYAYMFLGPPPEKTPAPTAPAEALPVSIRPTGQFLPSSPAAESSSEPTAVADIAEPAAQKQSTGDDGTVKWNDPDFTRAATLFNSALEKFTRFQKTRTNRGDLPTVETQCREAIQLFQKCKGRAPAGLKIQPFIDDCYHLISDVRHSTLISQ